MSKIEIVQRVISSVGRLDSKLLRTGALDERGWEKITTAATKMFKAPLYIDDSSVVNVTDIRAKCRRLERSSGLDLVVVDYLAADAGEQSREPPAGDRRDLPQPQESGLRAQRADHRGVAVESLGRTTRGQTTSPFRSARVRSTRARCRHRHVHLPRRVLPVRHARPKASPKSMSPSTAAARPTRSSSRFFPDYTLFADLGRDRQ